MKNFVLTLKGTTGLVHHDPRGVDPDEPISKEIKKLTSKKTKTEEDRRAIAKLEWFSGLVVDLKNEPAIKATAIRKCLQEAAVVTKKGKAVDRAVIFDDMFAPLVYEGPREPKLLWETGKFNYWVPVVVQRNRLMRMRPIFHQWAAQIKGVLLEDVLDLDDFKNISELSGRIAGLGDNRKNGFGRFQAQLKVV